MNPTIIVSKDELKETLTEISREIAQTVVNEFKAGTPQPRELMTLAQTAAYLQCSVQSVKNWSNRPTNQNPLPVCYAGADPRFYRHQVDEWLQRERQARQNSKA